MTLTRKRTTALLVATLAVLTLAITTVLAGLGSHHAAKADTPTTTSDTVSVSGDGTVEGTPDTLNAAFDVRVKRTSVQKALNASNHAARKAIAALRKDGVASKDIHTENVFVERGKGGYVAGQTLDVSIHPLKHVGKILTDTSNSAGNAVRLDGVSYDIANNEKLLANAQAKAFAQAKTAAEKDASLAGRSLGRVISIKQNYYDGDDEDDDFGYASSAGTAAGTKAIPVPIQPGQQSVDVTVAVVWALQ